MALHPGDEKEQFPKEAPVAPDLNRPGLNQSDLNQQNLSQEDLGKIGDWCRDLVEYSQDLICVHDLEGRFLSVNPVPARLLGYSVEEMVQKPMRDFIAPRFQEQFGEYLREIKAVGEAHGLIAVMTRGGEQRIWEYHNTLRTGGVRTPIVRGIAHDVTDRVGAEKALRVSNDRLLKTAEEQERTIRELTLFRTLLDQSNDAIKVIDAKTLRILDVNESAYRELGYSREEFLSLTIRDIDPSADESVQARVRQQLRESGSAIRETVHRRKDGTTFPVELNLRQVRLDREYIVSISRDISDRKLTEERLRGFERVVENLEEMIVVVNREYQYVLANRAYLRYRGMTKEELVGRSSAESLNPGVFDGVVKEKLDKCFQGQVVDYELRYQYPEIGERDLSIRYLPVEDPTGIDRVACIVRDVTERKHAEVALRESEARFRAVYERSPLGIALVDSCSGRFLQVNPKCCEITGRTEQELLRTDVGSITHSDDIGVTRDNLQQLAEEKVEHYELEKKYVRPDGAARWVRVLAVPMWSKGEQPRWHMGLVEDITERRQAEAKIDTLVQQLSEAKKKLTEEKLYLEHEIDTELGFGDIIGRSRAMQGIMEQVGKVAASDASVLLLGETGTGKGLVARAIHRLSLRANKGYIKVNCAAIPSGLLESELFGSERGAFTGAVGKKIGRLELADKGTLFLDEVGEIPLMLQPKLLRVLQDQEFERLGGIETLKVDFRLIAATNRELSDAVREKEFRSDLYYRLNVFPIRVPALRERREDIPLLVEHFVNKFAQRMKKSITSIPAKTMHELKSWDWPGNVRELENFVERSVILTQGSVLVSPLSELQSTAKADTVPDDRLAAAERDHILQALRQSRGQIGGVRGAAMRLGLKRTTLQSKLKQLGIKPRGGNGTR
jgi:PAS domain S-box-containing protein